MSRYTIRYRRDGDGWWYEVRDPKRVLVRGAWRAGEKRYAREEARRVRENHQRQQAEAA